MRRGRTTQRRCGIDLRGVAGGSRSRLSDFGVHLGGGGENVHDRRRAIHEVPSDTRERFDQDGIRANAVAPGLVLTAPVRDSLNAEFREQVLQMSRSPRLGAPEDIAAMVAFLASDDGEWINGQVLSVDGGAVLR
jgi:Enoyl-(Acyl carrier protein) reductase